MSAHRLLPCLAALCFLVCMPCVHAQVVYTATLSGGAEVPPTASAGAGSATITYFPKSSTMIVATSFAGLAGGTTAAHIHCCTPVAGTSNAGVASQTPAFAGFPTGVNAATYTNTFDMTLSSSYNASFVTASGSVALALNRLLEGMGNGTAYFNIHTTPFAGGEIRGNLVERSLFRSSFE